MCSLRNCSEVLLLCHLSQADLTKHGSLTLPQGLRGQQVLLSLQWDEAAHCSIVVISLGLQSSTAVLVKLFAHPM